jgi:K+-transporting ATPase ATPase C chain
MDEKVLATLVADHTEQRQFGVLGEVRVNVLELNLALDERYPLKK